jgi:hypothetical protein
MLNFTLPELSNAVQAEQIHSGILDYARDYIRIFKNYPTLLNVSAADAAAPFLFAANSPEYMEYIMDCYRMREAQAE